MGKNKDPAVLFYTSDFLVGVQNLTMEERGQYITLLCLQHQQGHLSEKLIKLAVGTISPDVLAKFQVDDVGLYYQHRMEEEALKREQYLDKQRSNGSKGGRPVKPNENPRVNFGLTQTKPNKNPNDNPNKTTRVENENINEDIDSIDNNNINTTNIIQQRFNQFWAAYPKKVGKAYAKQCFDRLKPTAELTQKMLDAIAEQKKSAEWTRDNGQFIPHPSTWLNQGRWDDELRTSQDGAADVVPKYSTFDAEQAMQAAIERSLYGI